ncbi:hypothetical protein F5884DRAFT_345345 [Xylogone sp. PMI_703]|nr:hypothetical protein F5884DRAFT_345345 [Xylogone sp. PMI_703]
MDQIYLCPVRPSTRTHQSSRFTVTSRNILLLAPDLLLEMVFTKLIAFFAPLAVVVQAVAVASSDTVDVAFYTSNNCDLGYIETKSVAINQCFALTDDIWFGSYLVPPSIPKSILDQNLLLEAGDTNPVDCSIGRCVELSESLGCQPALNNGEAAWWFGMRKL